MATAILSAARLRELLHYDQETGVFTRKVRTSARIRVGDVTGTPRPDGYLTIRVESKSYLAHRLAWLYVHGNFPLFQIDHINHVRSDNRITNLRDVTPSQNQHNQQRAHATNKSCGLLGVTLVKSENRWIARIYVNDKPQHIGSFKTPEAAHAAYLKRKSEIHHPV